MTIFELEDKTRIAVRGSGTEPKIKYYIFGRQLPETGKFSEEELTAAKKEVGQRLEQIWAFIEKDAHARVN